MGKDKEELVFDRSEMHQYFSNLISVTSTEEEVMIDFGTRDVEQLNHVKMAARVVLTPGHAARFLATLAKNLKSRAEEAEKAGEEEEGGVDDENTT